MPEEVGDAYSGNRHRILEGEKQPQPGALAGVEFPQIATVDADRALRDLILGMTDQSVSERALAGSVRPHQGVNLSLSDLEVDSFEDLGLADGYVQVINLQQAWHISFTQTFGASVTGSVSDNGTDPTQFVGAGTGGNCTHGPILAIG